jgi:hypothetical protein
MRWFIFAAIAGLSLVFSAQCELLHKIPFQFQDGLIWVQVELAGTKAPLNYLLDSGASITAIDLQTAQACRIHLGDPQSVEGVAGSSVAYRVSNFQAMVGDTLLPKSIRWPFLDLLYDRSAVPALPGKLENTPRANTIIPSLMIVFIFLC